MPQYFANSLFSVLIFLAVVNCTVFSTTLLDTNAKLQRNHCSNSWESLVGKKLLQNIWNNRGIQIFVEQKALLQAVEKLSIYGVSSRHDSVTLAPWKHLKNKNVRNIVFIQKRTKFCLCRNNEIDWLRNLYVSN